MVGTRRVSSFEVDSNLKERSPGWLDNMYEGVGDSIVEIFGIFLFYLETM